MKIRIEPHTLIRAAERGASESEIIDTLMSGQAVEAKRTRLAKAKLFPFHQQRNGSFYEEKKIELYYVIENEEYVTVTVYVFYGKF